MFITHFRNINKYYNNNVVQIKSYECFLGKYFVTNFNVLLRTTIYSYLNSGK